MAIFHGMSRRMATVVDRLGAAAVPHLDRSRTHLRGRRFRRSQRQLMATHADRDAGRDGVSSHRGRTGDENDGGRANRPDLVERHDQVRAGSGPYNAAKAAVGALVRSIVVDCTRNGIQANAVARGWVYTPMVASYIDQSAPRSSSMVVKRYERRCRNRRRPHHIGPVLAQGVTTLPLNHHCMSPS